LRPALAIALQHNGAAFLNYPAHRRSRRGESHMRFIFGLIIGCAVTVGGAYIADSMASPDVGKMVNWDVVAKNIDTVTTLAKEGWKKITG